MRTPRSPGRAAGDYGSNSTTSTDHWTEGLYDMLLALCDEMYKYLRPRLLAATDVDELCEIIGVIREEIVEENRGRHGRSQARR